MIKFLSNQRERERERETDRDRQRQRQTDKETEREIPLLCMYSETWLFNLENF